MLTLLMFVEGKKWIRSAGGEKEKKIERDEKGESQRRLWFVREKQKEEDNRNFLLKEEYSSLSRSGKSKTNQYSQ